MNSYSPKHRVLGVKNAICVAPDEDVENQMDFEQHMGSPARPDHTDIPDGQNLVDNSFAIDDEEEMLDCSGDR